MFQSKIHGLLTFLHKRIEQRNQPPIIFLHQPHYVSTLMYSLTILVMLARNIQRNFVYFIALKRIYNIRRNSNGYFLSFLENDDDVISVQDIYKIDKDSQKIDYVEYGRWNHRDGMQVQKENIWMRRANMKGHQLK